VRVDDLRVGDLGSGALHNMKQYEHEMVLVA